MQKNDLLKMIKTGELFFKIKEKFNVLRIKNNVIKNLQLQQRELCRIKKKYLKKIIEEVHNEKKMLPSDKVWVCWFQGEENAPDLVKKCVESIKKAFKDKEVIIISKDNYKKYINFPTYIEKKYSEGIIPYAHFSDLLRIELLAKYGGIWCDATLYITGEIPDYITNTELFVFKKIGLDKTDDEPIAASSWFISAYSNNKIILKTRDLLFEYWRKEKFLTNYLLFHLFFKIVTDKYKEEWDKVPTFNNVSPHILQFELCNEYNEERFDQIKAMSFIHKLSRHIEKNNKVGNSFLDYILNN